MNKKLVCSLLVVATLWMSQPAYVRGEQSDSEHMSQMSNEAVSFDTAAHFTETEEQETEEQYTSTEMIRDADEEAVSPLVATNIPAIQDGVYRESGRLFYYVDGHTTEGLINHDGQLLYAAQDGSIRSGVVDVADQSYVLVDNVVATSKWVLVDNQWYYANETGAPAKGWRYDEQYRAWYYFATDGKMVQAGWQDIAGKRYFFAPDGAMQKGWIRDHDNWYFLTETGAMKTGWYLDERNKTWFYLNDAGVMQTGWIQLGEERYYLVASGQMKTGWFYDEHQKVWFYLNEGGDMKRGWLRLGNQYYYLQADGQMKTGWFYDDAYRAWFYLNEGGDMKRGWLRIGDQYYYLMEGGQMKTGWLYDPTYRGWFYFNDSGAMFRGFRFDSVYKGWYYFEHSGKMATQRTYVPQYARHVAVRPDGRVADESIVLFQLGGAQAPTSVSVLQARQRFLDMDRIIFLDPGHGGLDAGASYYGIKEKDLALSVYRQLKERLTAAGYQVLTSRETDVHVDFVRERSRMANKTDADLFLSIHFNASGTGAGTRANGIETYWYEADADYTPRINKEMHTDQYRLERSGALAKLVHQELISETGANNRGVKRENFAVLRETAIPAVLVELGFMDNWEESQKIRRADYQAQLVTGLFKGIQKYYQQFSAQ